MLKPFNGSLSAIVKALKGFGVIPLLLAICIVFNKCGRILTNLLISLSLGHPNDGDSSRQIKPPHQPAHNPASYTRERNEQGHKCSYLKISGKML